MVLTMVEKFRCPVTAPYIITQTYQEHLAYAKEHPEISYNGGIDLYSDDFAVCAAFDGIVEKIAYQGGGYGNYIKLKHSWGYSLYAHLDHVCCNPDNRVTAGMKIGEMGSTGFSTGRHLHFEMRDLTNTVIDPSEFFIGDGSGVTVPGKCVNARSHLTAIAAPAGANLRKTPMGDLITVIPNGTVGRIIDGPVYRFGLACYQVEFPVTGWMAESDQFGTKILEDYGEEKNGIV